MFAARIVNENAGKRKVENYTVIYLQFSIRLEMYSFISVRVTNLLLTELKKGRHGNSQKQILCLCPLVSCNMYHIKRCFKCNV
jgi:hypothetical protein